MCNLSYSEDWGRRITIWGLLDGRESSRPAWETLQEETRMVMDTAQQYSACLASVWPQIQSTIQQPRSRGPENTSQGAWIQSQLQTDRQPQETVTERRRAKAWRLAAKLTLGRRVSLGHWVHKDESLPLGADVSREELWSVVIPSPGTTGGSTRSPLFAWDSQ